MEATHERKANGLVCQYFPKHTDLTVHSADDLARVALEINHRPRLVLGDRKPLEVMTDLITTCNTS
jgi:IS30 family transposase